MLRQRCAAYRDLLGHYGAVLAYCWRQRHQMGGAIFNHHEAAFLPAALSLQETPPSSTLRWTARSLIALLASALLWSIFGRIDIIANAGGKIVPSGRSKTIASVEVASVRALHVVEGQRVKAGAVLIELDTSASDSERDKALGAQGDGVLQVARARALIAAIDSGRPPQLPSRLALQAAAHADIADAAWQNEQSHLEGIYRDYAAKLARIDGDVVRFGLALPLATQRASDYHAMLREHDVAEHAWLEKEQARIDIAGQLADARHQRAALIAETRRMAYDQIGEGGKLADAARQDAIRSASRSKLLRLSAPVDGTVQQLTVHTIGGVVPAAQALMQIVPDDSAVEVEAFLENKDVGFVQEGQSAAVKIDAFEYNKYGTIAAAVSHVARDAVQDDKHGLIYSTQLTLAQSTMVVDGKPMPLSPGMAVSVEIKTGSRRIIEYLLSPLIQHQREALHER